MFQLPKEIKDELKRYKSSLQELLQGKSSEARFKGIRVPWGIYSHRGGKVYMTRMRIPAGIVAAEQLKALAEAAKKWGNGVLHVTTRQDIQLHEVAIADTIKIMEFLEGYDLSPRGGGGNTVRNVTACALSGICPDEHFEVRRDAVALTEYLIRQESSFNLPRKFKVAFSGCATDCAGTLVNDVGLLARPGGYQVFVGGGMGAESALGQLLEEKLAAADVGYCVQAIKNVYHAKGDRRNRRRNRLRFLIKDLGFAEFKQLYQHEFNNLKENEYLALRKVDFTAPRENAGEIPAADDPEFKSFLQYSVRPQKQKGFSVVELRLPQADIAADKLAQVAGLGNYEFRASQNQNLFVAWVPNQDLFQLFQKLKAISADFFFPQTLLDVTACKGALTCNLGVCNSPGLARALEEMIRANFVGTKVFTKLEIKVNGCPNACGQQPLGKISMYGLIRRVDNRPVPFYRFFLGGRKEGEKTMLAEAVGMVPARNVPALLKDFLAKAEAEISAAADVYAFLDGRGKQLAVELLEKYAYVPTFAENREFYIDWGRSEEFSLAGLGPGECGAGVIDMIEADLHEAKAALEAGDTRRGLFLAARALLVVKGIDPRDEQEAFKSFKTKFIDEGIAAKDYNKIGEVYEEHYARDFLGHVEGIYKSMDPFFNFPVPGKTAPAAAAAKETVHFMDLKGTPCPINYVKAKIFLENLASGSLLEMLLDEGEPIRNVPKSLENDGHKVLKIDKEGEIYRVLVRKK